MPMAQDIGSIQGTAVLMDMLDTMLMPKLKLVLMLLHIQGTVLMLMRIKGPAKLHFSCQQGPQYCTWMGPSTCSGPALYPGLSSKLLTV